MSKDAHYEVLLGDMARVRTAMVNAILKCRIISRIEPYGISFLTWDPSFIYPTAAMQFRYWELPLRIARVRLVENI